MNKDCSEILLNDTLESNLVINPDLILDVDFSILNYHN